MAKNRDRAQDLTQRQELSPEQREHGKENRIRDDEAIDNRKTDGPNTPAT